MRAISYGNLISRSPVQMENLLLQELCQKLWEKSADSRIIQKKDRLQKLYQEFLPHIDFFMQEMFRVNLRTQDSIDFWGEQKYKCYFDQNIILAMEVLEGFSPLRYPSGKGKLVPFIGILIEEYGQVSQCQIISDHLDKYIFHWVKI